MLRTVWRREDDGIGSCICASDSLCDFNARHARSGRDGSMGRRVVRRSFDRSRQGAKTVRLVIFGIRGCKVEPIGKPISGAGPGIQAVVPEDFGRPKAEVASVRIRSPEASLHRSRRSQAPRPR